MEPKFVPGLLCAAALASSAALADVTCSNENTAVTEATPTADFADNGDGTVTHTKTGLVWMRCSLGQAWGGGTCTGVASTYIWQQALQAAADVNSGASNADGDGHAGYADERDWRLPNRNELGSIVEYRCWSPAINGDPFPNTPASRFWSSSPSEQPDFAWYVDFGVDRVAAFSKDDTYRVRLVRAGQ